MNIAAIQTFLTVVETRNLNRTAERLNVTQSTVSARLDALDNALGQRLLDRARSGAELTKAGFAFLGQAEQIVRSWEQAQARVGLPKGFSGLFSFACPGELWDGLGADWLRTAQTEHPDLAFEVWPGESAEVARWLTSGLVDAAMLPQTVAGHRLSTRSYGDDRIVQVATRARQAVDWDPSYIYVDHGPDVRRQHARAWPGDETAHVSFGASAPALSYLLEHGGSAYLPWRLVDELVSQGRLHPVAGAPEFRRAIHLHWRESSLPDFPWIPELAPL